MKCVQKGEMMTYVPEAVIHIQQATDEPMSTKIHNAIWHHQALMSWDGHLSANLLSALSHP